MSTATQNDNASHERCVREDLERELHARTERCDLAELSAVMLALGELELDRLREDVGRRVVVDIDELPRVIEASARAVLAAHDYVIAIDPILPEEDIPTPLRAHALSAPKRVTINESADLFRELGRNLAGVIAVLGARVDGGGSR